MIADDRRHVGKRPLLPLVRALGAAADEKQWPKRVTRVQRAVASAARVGDAAPVDRLVSRLQREDEVTRVRER